MSKKEKRGFLNRLLWGPEEQAGSEAASVDTQDDVRVEPIPAAETKPVPAPQREERTSSDLTAVRDHAVDVPTPKLDVPHVDFDGSAPQGDGSAPPIEVGRIDSIQDRRDQEPDPHPDAGPKLSIEPTLGSATEEPTAERSDPPLKADSLIEPDTLATSSTSHGVENDAAPVDWRDMFDGAPGRPETQEQAPDTQPAPEADAATPAASPPEALDSQPPATDMFLTPEERAQAAALSFDPPPTSPLPLDPEPLEPSGSTLKEPSDAPPAGESLAPEPDEDLKEAVPSEPMAEAETESEPEEKTGWFARLKQGLSRTSSALAGNISSIFTKRKLDDDTLEELEDALIQADLGIDAAMRVTEALAKGRYNKEISDTEVKTVLADEIETSLTPVAKPLELSSASPAVILMVGVNGTGKTTTIGKLAQKYSQEGKTVMLAAGDTFRAAAIEQLKIWGERTNATVIARDTGADAAGLAFDAMVEAKKEAVDVLLIDTAGRLQNKTELMAELEKVVRVIKKHDETAPHHVLLTLDATTGQNALNQVDVFGKAVGVTGLVMTKLDGTARGGILVAIAEKYALPVHFIGVGEAADDLQPFAARDFAEAIAGL